MAQICKDLNELCVFDYSQDIPGLISLIDAQRNLESLSFNCYNKKGMCEEIGKALARKGCTIKYLFLYHSIDIISHSFLTSLINIKELYIRCNNGSYEGIKELQKYLAISNFPNLQFLKFVSISCACYKELAMLIEKTEGNILDVSVNTSNKFVNNTEMLLKILIFGQ
jgi:hypothetical protein